MFIRVPSPQDFADLLRISSFSSIQNKDKCDVILKMKLRYSIRVRVMKTRKTRRSAGNTRIPAAAADHKIETLQMKTRKRKRNENEENEDLLALLVFIYFILMFIRVPPPPQDFADLLRISSFSSIQNKDKCDVILKMKLRYSI